MNMKKTIAAIAAGAVAVSAMATTVSALEAKTLTYNLVKSVKQSNAEGTITATFTNVPLEAGGEVVIEAIGTSGASGAVNSDNSWGNFIMTISGSFWDDEAGTNKSFVPVVATRRSWETGYSVEGARCTQGNIVTLPVVASKGATGTDVALISSSSAVITVTLKYTDLPSDVNYAGAINELIRDGKRGIKLTSRVGTGSSSAASATYKANAGATAAGVYIKDQDALNALAGTAGKKLKLNASYKWVVAGTDDKLEVSSVNIANGGAPMTDKDQITTTVASIPAAVTASGTFVLHSDGTDWFDESLNVWTAALTDGSGATLASGDTMTVTFTKGTADGTTDLSEQVYKAIDFFNVVTVGDTLELTGAANVSGNLWASPISGAAVDASASTPDKYPYRSSLGNSIFGTDTVGDGDVLNYIAWVLAGESEDDWGTPKYYEYRASVQAVINDCIQNYGDVVFTFNTATEKVNESNGKYDSLDGTDKYMSFGKHFWDRDTGYDANTIYIANDWLGNNLFEGALIINNNLTLSLGATDKFDWKATSLSFSWDAIQDAALTQNQYANYIQTMILRTSTVWYWDNMTVSLGETEAEDMAEGAPVEGDTEDLPEEEETDVDFGEEEEEEEEPEATEPEPEPAPVETATNPGTGNAPVALAVIPVALAAAAVVAKKRG